MYGDVVYCAVLLCKSKNKSKHTRKTKSPLWLYNISIRQKLADSPKQEIKKRKNDAKLRLWDLFMRCDGGLYEVRSYCQKQLNGSCTAPACAFTPLSWVTVWKSHCGIGGLGGCIMSSHRNKMSCCCWCGCEWSLLCFFSLGGIVLREIQSDPSSPILPHPVHRYGFCTDNVCPASPYKSFLHLHMCIGHVHNAQNKRETSKQNHVMIQFLDHLHEKKHMVVAMLILEYKHNFYPLLLCIWARRVTLCNWLFATLHNPH